ncbi:MAG: nicotinamide mononucleotide transporter [Bacteroidales bacterium]|nr:nicotinamide mononucleotide transporter [Bacteroidales bacterium]
MLDWVENNWLEIFGAATGLLYIYFSIKQNILLWITGLISCSVYIIVFFNSQFYADMALQLYYVVISIYGWFYWSDTKSKSKEVLKVSKTPQREILILSILSVFIFFIIGFFLDKLTDSTIPFGDSLTTTLGIIATWMLAKKYIEQWLIWIIADFIAAGLYFYKELYPTTILYIIFAVMAFIGYFQWKKSITNEQTKTA